MIFHCVCFKVSTFRLLFLVSIHCIKSSVLYYDVDFIESLSVVGPSEIIWEQLRQSLMQLFEQHVIVISELCAN